MHVWSPQDWITSHKKRGIQPVISNPSRQVMHLLEKAGIPELIGEEYITVRVNDAVLMCQVSAPLCPLPSRLTVCLPGPTHSHSPFHVSACSSCSLIAKQGKQALCCMVQQEVLAELGAHSTCVAEELQRKSIKDGCNNRPEASFSVTQKL